MNFVSYDFLFPSFGFVSNIPHTHTPRCLTPTPRYLFRSFGFVSKIPHTHTHTPRCLTPTPRYLFRSFGFVSNIPHTNTTMLNARPTIFSFGVLGLLSSFGFVSNIPHTHTPRCLMPAPRFFLSEFWVCYRVLGLFRTFHTHTSILNARPTIFSFGVVGLFRTFHTHHDA